MGFHRSAQFTYKPLKDGTHKFKRDIMKSDIIQISDDLFLKLGKMIAEKYGIKMPIEKKIMFQSRMQKRLRELSLESFDQYADVLLNTTSKKDEFTLMADYISTNKTEFFRENAHFDFLTHTVLPQIQQKAQSLPVPAIGIWSAGCSSGQESYSISITIEEYMRSKGFRLPYFVISTDISTRMLRIARDAIYPMAMVEDISMEIKQKYFLKSIGSNDPKAKLTREIREKVNFSYLNLMDEFYLLKDHFNIIFLRNTLIYFEPAVQKQVLSKVLERLADGGYLFIGHSESLINMNLPIRSVAPSVYIKINRSK